MRIINNNRGFSLIEMISALVLSAIIVSMAGMWIVNLTSGFLLTEQNAATVLKAQAALLRLDKELYIVVSSPAPSGTATTFNYTSVKEVSGSAAHTLSYSGGNILLDGDILIGNLSNFALSYRDTYSGAAVSTWAASNKIIDLTFTISDAGGSPFTMRVRPRSL